MENQRVSMFTSLPLTAWISLYADAQISDDNLLTKAVREQVENRWFEIESQLRDQDKKCAADDLANLRNDIQHGGFRTGRKPADFLINELNRLVQRFTEKVASNTAL